MLPLVVTRQRNIMWLPRTGQPRTTQPSLMDAIAAGYRINRIVMVEKCWICWPCCSGGFSSSTRGILIWALCTPLLFDEGICIIRDAAGFDRLSRPSAMSHPGCRHGPSWSIADEFDDGRAPAPCDTSKASRLVFISSRRQHQANCCPSLEGPTRWNRLIIDSQNGSRVTFRTV